MFCVYKYDVICYGIMLKKSKNQIQDREPRVCVRVYLLLLIPNFETKFSIQYLVTTIDIISPPWIGYHVIAWYAFDF